ncbi:hypothetical protein V6N11_024982 [Hibiscus sabdariffa]|uniref:Uncharacterized protein n=1 Tax=Hibiscus sabdariffa TaxID=183260 RepID=A0ABR2QNM9_9ROSI
MTGTMNSTHIVVVVSENADPNIINVVVTEGLSLLRRLEPPDRLVIDATLPQTATSVKILGIGHVVNQLIQDSMMLPVHDASPMCSLKDYVRSADAFAHSPCLHEFLSDSSEWDIPCITHLLRSGVIPHIMAVFPLSLEGQPDSIAWSRTALRILCGILLGYHE